MTLARKDDHNPLMALIERAIGDESFSVEKLEHLLSVKERWDKEEARKAYVAALAEFKADPPHIVKDKRVSFGNTKYRHATLGQVVDAVTGALAQHGLSVSWPVKQEGNEITVTCVLTHAQGHSESVSITGPRDESGQKNGNQQIGSAITYLQRYTLMAIMGLAAADMDDDGQASGERRPEPRPAPRPTSPTPNPYLADIEGHGFTQPGEFDDLLGSIEDDDPDARLKRNAVVIAARRQGLDYNAEDGRFHVNVLEGQDRLIDAPQESAH